MARDRWAAGMVVAAAAHHGFELGAGAGLMLQRELRLPAAVAGWVVIFPALMRLTWRRSARGSRVLAFACGANLAAAAVHYTLWPWRLWPSRRCGVPVLTSAEGLAHGHLPVYNGILLGWVASAAGAVIELEPGTRRWALAGFLLALPLRAHARHHFDWVRHQAEVRPAWWNRALQPQR